MWKLQLSDGTELNIARCGAADGILWIVLLGMSLVDAMAVFSDMNKTIRMTAYGNIVHHRYTKLIHISLESDNSVKIALRRE